MGNACGWLTEFLKGVSLSWQLIGELCREQSGD